MDNSLNAFLLRTQHHDRRTLTHCLCWALGIDVAAKGYDNEFYSGYQLALMDAMLKTYVPNNLFHLAYIVQSKSDEEIVADLSFSDSDLRNADRLLFLLRKQIPGRNCQ